MEEQEKTIELFPGNWLFNAGVIGFLSVLDDCKFDVSEILNRDGTITGDISELFERKISHYNYKVPELVYQWFISSGYKIKKDYKKESLEDPIKEIWGTLFNVFYRGFFNANPEYLYKPSKSSQALLMTFIDFTSNLFVYQNSNPKCSFCLKGGEQTYKNNFSSEHYKELGGSDGSGGMPNSFWNNQKSIGGAKICDTCSFLMLNRHFSFTRLTDNTNIFINAPSFQLMYELNRLMKELAGKENASYRNLLAMSIVEFSIKTNVMLNTWTAMDIEIVAIKQDKIDFISLPYETVKLLSNRKIAELISSIGDFKILNLVINQKWDDLVEISYRLLKISLNGIGKEDRGFLNQFYVPENYKTVNNIKILANKLLKLYSLITERIK